MGSRACMASTSARAGSWRRSADAATRSPRSACRLKARPFIRLSPFRTRLKQHDLRRGALSTHDALLGRRRCGRLPRSWCRGRSLGAHAPARGLVLAMRDDDVDVVAEVAQVGPPVRAARGWGRLGRCRRRFRTRRAWPCTRRWWSGTPSYRGLIWGARLFYACATGKQARTRCSGQIESQGVEGKPARPGDDGLFRKGVCKACGQRKECKWRLQNERPLPGGRSRRFALSIFRFFLPLMRLGRLLLSPSFPRPRGLTLRLPPPTIAGSPGYVRRHPFSETHRRSHFHDCDYGAGAGRARAVLYGELALFLPLPLGVVGSAG